MVRLRQQNSSFLLLEASRIKRKIDGNSYLINRNLTKECDCMGKAILAMIVTVIVGFMSSAIFANWVNAPEWGIVLAIAVMGGFIIYFNDKKK